MTTLQPFPLAIEPPATDATIMTQKILDKAVALSRKSPRKRIIYPFHKSDNDMLHRMLNAIQPNSYVRPHMHNDPPKSESVVMLRGALKYIIFESDGSVKDHFVLKAGTSRFGVDLEPGVIHSMAALEPDTVLYESKTGPYVKLNDKQFAAFSPEEKSPDVPDYLKFLYSL